MVWFGILAGVAVLFLAVLYYVFRLTFYYKDPKGNPLDYVKTEQTNKYKDQFDRLIVEFSHVEWEEVSIVSKDGLKLVGRYFHVADGAPLEILLHGYKGSRVRDFCGIWPLAKELGHNVLLVDQRAHGDSESHITTFGIKERYDCLLWVDYACKRFGQVPMMLMGVSMGAATVLMASGMNLPENVKCIVADCPYDSPRNIIKKVAGKDMGLPASLVYPLVRLGGMLFGGFDLESYSPLEAIKEAKVPILLVHSDEDTFVPYEMSCNLHKAEPEKIEFHTVHGAAHASSSAAVPEEYRKMFINFVETHIR